MMISEDEAPVACYVVGVDEEVEIARATLECLRKGQSSK
jgi:acetate kinase